MLEMNLRQTVAIVTIMGAMSAFVNAAPLVLTEKKSSAKFENRGVITVADLVDQMLRKAKDDYLAPDQARFYNLTPRAPIKFRSVKFSSGRWAQRWCDLVLDEAAPTPTPRCFVLITKQQHGKTLTFTSYRLDLHGKLESAHRFSGKIDDGGRPIHGSLTDEPIDADTKDVQRDASEELRFWLSNRGEDLK